MTQYYFLATALPELTMDEPPDISFYELENFLKLNLSAEDLEKTKIIRRYYDIENIRSFWRGDEALDHFGNLNALELEEALDNRVNLPQYLFDFMDKYENNESRLKNFSELFHTYFAYESERSSGFLKKYLAFERDWRLILVAFRAKSLKRDVEFELQTENPEDAIIAQILANKDADVYEPPANYRELGPIFHANEQDSLTLYKALTEYRIAKIDEFIGFDFFSIGRILGYLAKFIIIEKWMALDRKKGTSIVNQFLAKV